MCRLKPNAAIRQKDKARVTVGVLGAPFRTRGWIKVISYTDEADGIFKYSPWLIKHQGRWVEVNIESWSQHNKDLVAKLEELNIREEARALAGSEISISTDSLPKLPDHDFYWNELLGMKVVTVEGYDIGRVISLIETGSNDVLVVKKSKLDSKIDRRECLIPLLIDRVVKKVDREAQLIEVEWSVQFG